MSKLSSKDYPLVHFGDVVRNVKVDADPLTSGLERYVAGEHMNTDDLHIRRWGTIGNGYLGPAFHRKFVKGQILYGSRRTYLRKVAVADFDGICANTTFVLEPEGDALIPELLPFIMQTESFHQHSIKQSKGSVNPYINWKDIAWYEFPLPPKDQQRRIAELLWAADEVVEKWQAVAADLDCALLSCREYLFSELNKWKSVRLDDLFDVQLGKMLSPKARTGLSPKPYLGNANVLWGHFDLTDIKEMDFDNNEIEKFRLEIGDLLVCEGGEVGRSAIWHGELQDCYYQKAIHRLRRISNDIYPEIMLQFMFYAARKGYFSYLTGTSTIAHLPMVKLKAIEVVVPKLEFQQKMLVVLKGLQGTIMKANLQLENSKKLKTNLINQCSV